MRISDWSSDVCSSDLDPGPQPTRRRLRSLDAEALHEALAGGEVEAGRAGQLLEAFRRAHERRLGPPGTVARLGTRPEQAQGRRARSRGEKIGRASCRERVWRDV